MDHGCGNYLRDDPQHQQQFNIGSFALTSTMISSSAIPNLDSKQSRLRQLQLFLQQRLQKEIADTDERIQRYTEQQFALLKSFREKSEQEYEMLVRLIQRVPEQQANEWLDRSPPPLELSDGGTAAVFTYGPNRRKNTITSRRDLIGGTPLTPNTPTVNNHFFTSNIYNLNNTSSSLNTFYSTQSINVNGNNENVLETTLTEKSKSTVQSGINKKLADLETPPDTPEATPMSLSNSPTFRQQQQQQLQQKTISLSHSCNFQESPDILDDCLFELEGVDEDTAGSCNTNLTTNLNEETTAWSKNIKPMIITSNANNGSSNSNSNTNTIHSDDNASPQEELEAHMSDVDDTSSDVSAEEAEGK